MLVAVALILGIIAGALIAVAVFSGDINRMTRFLQQRPAGSNARLTRGSSAPGLADLVDAINAELDRSDEARIAVQRSQREFQRDLSSLSHDIRTPLMGAKGYLQLACDEVEPDERAARLSAATDRIDATAALLDQLFSYTKASDPDLDLACEPLKLKPLVERVLLGHFPEFEERDWEPELVAQPQDASLCANSDALERILENLVVNALRYGVDAPRIALARGRIRIANRVADPAELDVTRLFDRFYQADTARGKSGAGLGLATAAKLARAMGLELSATLDGDVLTIELLQSEMGISAVMATGGKELPC